MLDDPKEVLLEELARGVLPLALAIPTLLLWIFGLDFYTTSTSPRPSSLLSNGGRRLIPSRHPRDLFYTTLSLSLPLPLTRPLLTLEGVPHNYRFAFSSPCQLLTAYSLF